MSTRTTRTIAAAAALGTVTAVMAVAPAFAEPEPAASAAMLAPYYTELDLTGDRQVDADDLAVAARYLGVTAADAAWPEIAVIDTDVDGAITIADLAALSQRMIYDDGPFELIEASTVDMQAAMNAGVITSVELTTAYLKRIKAYDDTVIPYPVDPAAPAITTNTARPLNAIITTSSTALEAAAAADAERAAHGMTSMLLGVPVAVKDNYNTKDMVTTGGCGCWNGNQTAGDAHMVEGLRADGAIIIAKASLDEFAYGFSSQFSAFQPAGSSLYVASPYDTTKTAGGSSGGTGAAIAANLAGIGFGTDTGGSIRVPSSYNQLVGIRPTVGLASRDGIIPLALSQDTGGPIARSVTDAALALDAVVGVDENDAVTQRQVGKVPESYASFLDPGALKGARIGVIGSLSGTGDTATRFAAARDLLTAQGATVVTITPPAEFTAVTGEGSGSTNEFKHDLDQYIASYLNPNVTARSLQGIIDSGSFVPGYRSTYVSRNAITPETYEAWAGAEGSHTRQIAAGKALVTKMMDDADLDAIIYPSTHAYGTIDTKYMRLSPNTGLPAVTVPMSASGTGEGGQTVGTNIEFLGRDFSEGTLIGLAYSYEQVTHARTSPRIFGALK
ncbi:amidase family protein [Microbacterium sp. BG28]|uniref:amidase family protein n=1 Tax=Microbacterium sp. BG28 TaxID=3097356 RepID=UPI002A59D0D6|nr:amidase family protein [Microbacterium sp. BG28]MDY0827700.1 amidase family protein [Microbacterium sp. BG28]